jgi:hypothetical protein
MLNRFEQIRQVLQKNKGDSAATVAISDLCGPIEDHVESILGNYLGVRSWIPKSEAAISITECDRPIGCEVTSKKGEIAETPFNVDIEETRFLPYGLKLSITNGQLRKATNEDSQVDVLERFMSSMAVGMQAAESLVFLKFIVDRISGARKPIVNNGTIEVSSLNKLFREVEEGGWLVEDIIMDANTYAGIRCFGKDFYDEATTREIQTCGLYGHLWTSDIRVLPVRKHFPYVLAIGKKGEKLVYKEDGTDRWGNPRQTVDHSQSIYRNSVEHVVPGERVKVTYGFHQQQDPARSRHVFEARGSIGIRINNLAGLAVVEMAE